MKKLLKEIKQIQIKTFEYEDGFMIDVVSDYKNRTWEVYLYHKICRIKDLMFVTPFEDYDCPSKELTIEEVIEIVYVNLKAYDYLGNYKTNYFNNYYNDFEEI